MKILEELFFIGRGLPKLERLFLKCGVVFYTVYELCFNVLLSLLQEAIALIKRFSG